jgi:hypothetical protein
MRELLSAVVVFAACMSTASAGVITLDFRGKGPLGSNLSGVTAHYAGGTYGGSGAWAGQLKVEISGDSTFNFNGEKLVYCTELNEFAGSNKNYTMDYLSNATVPSTAPALTIGQKIALEKLFSLAGTVDTHAKAAGFQVAIWEISQDTDFGVLTGSSAGNFYLTGSGTNYDSILTKANHFLSQLGSQAQTSVLAMVSMGSQDFLGQSDSQLAGQGSITTPEPTSFAVWGLGLATLGFARRRRSSL